MELTDLEKAREWAEGDFDQAYIHAGPRAAAEVIRSLPDRWIDAEELRELVVKYEAFAEDAEPEGEKGRIRAALYRNFVGVLEALLPTPPLPTLADMTPEEREACQWMQAMFTKSVHEHVITCIFANKSRLMRRDDGMGFEVPNDEIIPLPDLPKLEWPGDGVKDAPIVDGEPTLPYPEDVPAGGPWLILHNGHEWVGTRDDSGTTNYPWALAKIDGTDYAFSRDVEVTLVSRLVPERKENA